MAGGIRSSAMDAAALVDRPSALSGGGVPTTVNVRTRVGRRAAKARAIMPPILAPTRMHTTFLAWRSCRCPFPPTGLPSRCRGLSKRRYPIRSCTACPGPCHAPLLPGDRERKSQAHDRRKAGGKSPLWHDRVSLTRIASRRPRSANPLRPPPDVRRAHIRRANNLD
jgi:hypothetical protein